MLVRHGSLGAATERVGKKTRRHINHDKNKVETAMNDQATPTFATITPSDRTKLLRTMTKWCDCAEEAAKFAYDHRSTIYSPSERVNGEFNLQRARMRMSEETHDRQAFIHHSNIMEYCLNIFYGIKHAPALMETKFYMFKPQDQVTNRSQGVAKLYIIKSAIESNYQSMLEHDPNDKFKKMDILYDTWIPDLLLMYRRYIASLPDLVTGVQERPTPEQEASEVLELLRTSTDGKQQGGDILGHEDDFALKKIYRKTAEAPTTTPTKLIPFNKDSVFVETPGAPKKPKAVSRTDGTAMACQRQLINDFDRHDAKKTAGPDLSRYIPEKKTLSQDWNPLL